MDSDNAATPPAVSDLPAEVREPLQRIADTLGRGMGGGPDVVIYLDETRQFAADHQQVREELGRIMRAGRSEGVNMPAPVDMDNQAAARIARAIVDGIQPTKTPPAGYEQYVLGLIVAMSEAEQVNTYVHMSALHDEQAMRRTIFDGVARARWIYAKQTMATRSRGYGKGSDHNGQ